MLSLLYGHCACAEVKAASVLPELTSFRTSIMTDSTGQQYNCSIPSSASSWSSSVAPQKVGLACTVHLCTTAKHVTVLCRLPYLVDAMAAAAFFCMQCLQRITGEPKQQLPHQLCAVSADEHLQSVICPPLVPTASATCACYCAFKMDLGLLLCCCRMPACRRQ